MVIIIEHLISKISSYELINYVFLGGLCFIIGVLLEIEIFLKVMNLFNSLETVILLVSYFIFVYFLGILISRIGSFIESLLKRFNIISYAPYNDYIKAEKEDPKISILTSQANLYRSLMGMFLAFILFTLTTEINELLSKLDNNTLSKLIILFVFILIFFFSWKKQVNYVKKRVENN